MADNLSDHRAHSASTHTNYLIQIVKERFGQRFRLTKAAHSTLTSCSVKLLFEVFNRLKTRLNNPKQLPLSGSGRRILQDQTPLSTPSKQPDENFSSHSNWRLSNTPSEAAHSTPSRRTVKLHFQANSLINKRFRRSILPDEEANYRPVRFSVKPYFRAGMKKPGSLTESRVLPCETQVFRPTDND